MTELYTYWYKHVRVCKTIYAVSSGANVCNCVAVRIGFRLCMVSWRDATFIRAQQIREMCAGLCTVAFADRWSTVAEQYGAGGVE